MRKRFLATLLSAVLTLSSLSQYVFADNPIPASEAVSVISGSDEEESEGIEEIKSETDETSVAETKTEEKVQSDESVSESEEENKTTAEDEMTSDLVEASSEGVTDDVAAVSMKTEAVNAAQPYAVEDYRAWSQKDSRWKNLIMGADSDVGTYGCTASSVTKLIIQAGLRNPDSFNIATFVNAMNSIGGFTSVGFLQWGYVPRIVPEFSDAGELIASGTYSASAYNQQFINWINAGFHMAVNVKNTNHWVAIDERKTLETGTVYIMDSDKWPYADATLAGSYTNFNRVHAYTGGSVASSTSVLDVNAKIDDTDYGWLGDYGSFDMYINGSLVGDDISDYCEELPVGTRYEIKDIKAAEGYVFVGPSYGSLIGTVGASATIIQLRVDSRGNKINFHCNEGTIWIFKNAHAVSAFNNSRWANELIVYTSAESYANAGTNGYGLEAAVDANGKVIAIRGYEDQRQMDFPTGGFIVSGHLQDPGCGYEFIATLHVGDYVGYDCYSVKAYDNESSYLVDYKYVKNGARYGSLPVPERSGYIFDGWYTSLNGGSKVTADSVYSTDQLYAHWVTALQAPDILQAQALNSHTIFFHWNRPAEASQVYIELYKENGTLVTAFQTDALEWKCDTLSDGTYTFKICSVGANGLRSQQNSVQVNIPYVSLPYEGQPVSEGLYTIVSAIDDRAQLSIESHGTWNTANVQLWSYDSVDEYDLFYPRYCNDGTYEIMNRYSGKVLDASGQGMSSGTNVHQYDSTGNENQKWILQSTGDGYFNIICFSNGLYLDAVGGRTDNGTNVQLHTPNGSDAQKWKFLTWGGGFGRTIEDGCYQIVNEVNHNRALGIKDSSQSNGAAVQLYETSKASNCLFDVTYLANGYYKIVNHASGKAFDAQNGNPYDGASLQQWNYSAADCQQWIIRVSGNGTFNIESKLNGLYVENLNGGVNIGNKIQLALQNNSSAQKWRFIPALPELTILTQPENVEAYNGDSVSLTISVKGEDVSYQWQVSTDNGKTWTNSAESGNKSNRLSFVMKSAYRGYQYRCLVSDKNDQQIISDIVTITQGYDCHGYIGDCVSAAFVDVPNYNNYQHKPIDWAVFNKITQGSDATHFRPDLDCTRAQVVTFLWRANGMPEPKSSKNPFVDVNSSAYYYKAVLWAVEKGITTGKDATHFLPDDKVSRSQFVTFLWRAADKPEPKTTKNVFVDVPSSTYYYKAVLWAAEKGITTGKDATHFLPDGTCTRGQVVTFLYRNAANK